MKKSNIILISLFILVISFSSGCTSKPISFTGETGNSTANIIMGNGNAGIYQSYIYYTDNNGLFEYDISTQSVIHLSDSPMAAINVTKSNLFYGDMQTYYIADFVGKNVKTLLKAENNGVIVFPCLRDNYVYEMTGKGDGGILLRYNVRTGNKETLAGPSIISYAISNDYLYIIKQDSNGKAGVYRSSFDDIKVFSKNELPFVPIEINISGDDIYVSEKGNFQVHHFKWDNSAETINSVYSLNFQVIDHFIYYLSSKGELFRKDLSNSQAEKVLISDHVLTYCVLDNKYIVYQINSSNGRQESILYTIESENSKNLSTLEKSTLGVE